MRHWTYLEKSKVLRASNDLNDAHVSRKKSDSLSQSSNYVQTHNSIMTKQTVLWKTREFQQRTNRLRAERRQPLFKTRPAAEPQVTFSPFLVILVAILANTDECLSCFLHSSRAAGERNLPKSVTKFDEVSNEIQRSQ